MISDNPARTADLELSPATRDFNDLPLIQRLDAICEKASVNVIYRMALDEALPMSDEYETWIRQLADSSVSDADVGRAARDIVCAYVAQVAQQREEEL